MRRKKHKVQFEAIALGLFIILLGGYVAYANISASGMFAATAASAPANADPEANKRCNAHWGALKNAKYNELIQQDPKPEPADAEQKAKNYADEQNKLFECGEHGKGKCDRGEAPHETPNVTVCRGDEASGLKASDKGLEDAKKAMGKGGSQGDKGGGDKGGGSGGGMPEMPKGQPKEGGGDKTQPCQAEQGATHGTTPSISSNGQPCPQKNTNPLDVVRQKIADFFGWPNPISSATAGESTTFDKQLKDIVDPAVKEFTEEHPNLDSNQFKKFEKYAATKYAVDGILPTQSETQNGVDHGFDAQIANLNPDNKPLSKLATENNILVPADGSFNDRVIASNNKGSGLSVDLVTRFYRWLFGR